MAGEALSPDALWDALREGQHAVYFTAKGLPFTYQVRGNELFVSRREKSVTRATVVLSYRRAWEIRASGGTVSGPKQLGTFGASYILPIFRELRLV